MKNKHISTYSTFLFEQDVMGMPPSSTPAATKKKIKYKFLFMTGNSDVGNNRRKYPDGSIIIEYPCYSIDANSLNSWIEENIISTDSNKLNSSELEVRKNSLIEIVKGDKINISNDDLPFIEKLKNATSTNLIGRLEPDVTVVFSNNVPTTDDIDVTFIKYSK